MATYRHICVECGFSERAHSLSEAQIECVRCSAPAPLFKLRPCESVTCGPEAHFLLPGVHAELVD